MREHITLVLASLHWHLVATGIDFKIILLVYKALNGLAPSYLKDCLPEYVPGCPLRSSSADVLCCSILFVPSCGVYFDHMY